MKTFTIRLRPLDCVSVDVEAETEAEAINKAKYSEKAHLALAESAEDIEFEVISVEEEPNSEN